MFHSCLSEATRQRPCTAGDSGQSSDHSVEVKSPIGSMGKSVQIAARPTLASPDGKRLRFRIFGTLRQTEITF
mgnify:CR=1 FL=1